MGGLEMELFMNIRNTNNHNNYCKTKEKLN